MYTLILKKSLASAASKDCMPDRTRQKEIAVNPSMLRANHKRVKSI